MLRRNAKGRYVLALGLCVVLTCALAPSTATADTLQFSGRSGIQKWWTWAPGVGLRPYRISTTIRASIYASHPRYVAVATIGIPYSTEALGPDTLLVYGLQYRKKGGHWRPVCVRRVCLFGSRKRAPWPGERIGAQYFKSDRRSSAPSTPSRRALCDLDVVAYPHGRAARRRRALFARARVLHQPQLVVAALAGLPEVAPPWGYDHKSASDTAKR